MRKTLVAVFLLGSVLPLSAAQPVDLQKTIQQLMTDIRSESEELAKTRAAVSAERVKLINRLRSLEKKVAPLRQKAYAVRNEKWLKEGRYQQMKEESDYLTGEVELCASILTEYRRDTLKRMTSAEEQRCHSRFEEIDHLLRLSKAGDILPAAEPLLELADARLRDNRGGFTFEGRCVQGNGDVLDGRFITAGPAVYFLSSDEKNGGWVGLRPGSLHPALIRPVRTSRLKKVLDNKAANLPIDFTIGEAVKSQESKKSLWQHIQAGGITMIPILGLGLFCFGVALWKWARFSKVRFPDDKIIGQITESLSSHNVKQAHVLAASMGDLSGPVLAEGIHHYKERKADMEEIIHEKILTLVPALEKGMPLLAVTAAASPLLGLLGTVTGMIRTFDLITIFGTGKAKLLAGGISEALVTTEFGLIMAIPALLAHVYFSRRIKIIIRSLEESAIVFINKLN